MSHAGFNVRRSPSTIVLAAFLTKLAKHLALLVCLAIVGQATGRAALGQPWILLLVVAAAAIHSLGQTLKRRCATNNRDAP